MCFLLGLAGHLQDFGLLAFCFLPPIALSFCQNVLILHKQCSDNRWVFFSSSFFFNPQNNVFSDCMFLTHFPFLHQQWYCYSGQMEQLYSSSDLCVQVSCRDSTVIRLHLAILYVYSDSGRWLNLELILWDLFKGVYSPWEWNNLSEARSLLTGLSGICRKAVRDFSLLPSCLSAAVSRPCSDWALSKRNTVTLSHSLLRQWLLDCFRPGVHVGAIRTYLFIYQMYIAILKPHLSCVT